MNRFDLQPNLGRRIVEWRRFHGISRRQLAKAIGIAHQSLKQIEDGRTSSPRIYNLIQIANYFEKNLGELLGEYWSDNTILIKIPPDVHLTDIDKSYLKMRVDFELSILKNKTIIDKRGISDEIKQ